MSRWCFLPVLFAAACKLDPAPETLDELFHRVWDAFPVDSGQDFDILVASVPDVIDVPALLDKHLEGNQSRLGVEQIADLPFFDAEGEPRDPPDPSDATPIYVVDRFACEGGVLEEILSYPDQNELYGVYEDYERRFEGPRDAFLAGDFDELGWDGTIHVKAAIIGEYTYEFHTDLRRIRLQPDSGTPGDTVWMTRNHMPIPAAWESENRAFSQDYQVELFVPIDGGDMVHLYPVWRQMEFGDLGSLENDGFASINVDQTLKFDKTTAKLCAEGLPTSE